MYCEMFGCMCHCSSVSLFGFKIYSSNSLSDLGASRVPTSNGNRFYAPRRSGWSRDALYMTKSIA